MNDSIDEAIRKATRTGRPYGPETFAVVLKVKLNQSERPKKPGRPRKKPGECPSFRPQKSRPEGRSGRLFWWERAAAVSRAVSRRSV